VSVTGDVFIEVAIKNASDAAEEHLSLCFESLDDPSVQIETAGPFCGCNTCVVREVIAKSWPYMRLLAIVESEDG
jgi:hypothetical protein